jgi:hypothetical protein
MSIRLCHGCLTCAWVHLSACKHAIVQRRRRINFLLACIVLLERCSARMTLGSTPV